MPEVKTEVPYFLQNTEERIIPEESEIIGTLPSWFRGSILSTAPGMFDLPKGSFNHWLDGLAMLQRFEVGERTIKFSKRFLQSEAFKNAIKDGKPSSIEYGTNPSNEAKAKKGMFSKLKPFGPYDHTDNNLGNICTFDTEETYCMNSYPYIYKFDPIALKTLEKKHVLKALNYNGINPYVKDTETGDLYTIGSSMSSGGLKNEVLRIKAKSNSQKLTLDKRIETICSIPSRWYGSITLQRCFGITKNYIIFVEQPVVFNAVKFTAINMKGYTVRDCIDWKDGEVNRFYLVEKHTGKLLKHEIYSEKQFYSLEFINSFEDGDSIIFDCIATHDLECMDKSTLNNLRKFPNIDSCTLSKIHRFKIPLIKDIKEFPENENILRNNGNNVTQQATAIKRGNAIFLTPEFPMNEEDTGMDFGHINFNHIGRKHKYCFLTSVLSSSNSKYYGKICKVNIDSGKIKTWSVGDDGYVVAVPMFVPKENYQKLIPLNTATCGIDEDDGIVVTACVSMLKRNRNFLVFIDGKSFEEIARCYFDEKIAYWVRPAFLP